MVGTGGWSTAPCRDRVWRRHEEADMPAEVIESVGAQGVYRHNEKKIPT